jgi:circadian clock protein KaiC
VVSTGIQDLDQILGAGYPARSSILVSGPPGVGKEALGYWFVHSGLVQGDFCFYVTHRPVTDVQKNMRAFGIHSDQDPEWMASSGSQKRCDLNNPALISSSIKEAINQNEAKHVRIVTDVLSPLLVLNSLDATYRDFSQLLRDIKQHDAVLLATAEEGMHPPNVVASMEQLFDGVIELRIYEIGLVLTPLLRIKKMLGLPPLHEYFRFSFSHGLMKITGAMTSEPSGKVKELGIGGWLRGPKRGKVDALKESWE